MNTFRNIWYRKPAAVVAVVQAAVVFAAAFGLALSGEQTAGVVGFMLALQGLFGDGQVVSRPGLEAVAAADWTTPNRGR